MRRYKEFKSLNKKISFSQVLKVQKRDKSDKIENMVHLKKLEIQY